MIRLFTFFSAILFLVTKVSSTKLDASTKHCTDPRTLLKHAANTEWADTYSCTRHRCQPGGRTLAIYTVGCKRVEPPESAIECEEVVEDTNMQFPFCCTRLRCLVVIHGEVWTKVLGQPWETLPAAPWSHMYKVKKPPPSDALQYKDLSPVFNAEDKLVNAAESSFIESISGKHHKKVINANVKPHAAPMKIHQRSHDSAEKDIEDPAEEESRLEAAEAEMEEAEPVVEHKNSVWAESSPKWVEDPSPDDASIIRRATKPKSVDFSHDIDKKKVKASTLQVLVDAIGSRMRDIEDVVQRMSSKVASEKEEHFESAEKKGPNDKDEDENIKEIAPTKKPRSNSNSHRSRFDSNGDTTFVRTTDYTTEQNLYANERGGIGFINEDVETPLVRRSANPKEPIRPTYMAPVDMRRKSVPPQLGVEHLGDNSEEHQMKHRKHKRKHSHRKKHHKESKRRKSDDESQEPSSKDDENVLDKKR